MAFSQKAMQEKKKIKETRKQTITTNQTNPNTAMLTMMNFLNMNKNKLDPHTMTQMMSACLETMINTTAQPKLLGNKRDMKRIGIIKKRKIIPQNNMNNLNNTIINPTAAYPNIVNPYPSFINPGSLNMINNFPPK
jgi:hypothetical protein